MVPKTSPDSWRFSGNYRQFSSITKPDLDPILHIHGFNYKLGGKKFFSKISLVEPFTKIPVTPEAIPKTVITTPSELFESVVMTFGLHNTDQTFQ